MLITRHLILVIALSVSMFVGLAVSIWTVVMDQVNGTYVFLIFSDAFLRFAHYLNLVISFFVKAFEFLFLGV